MRYITTIEGREFQIEVLDERHVLLDGQIYAVDFNSVGNQPVYSLLLDGKSYEAYVYQGEEDWQVLLHGRLYDMQVEDEREKRLRATARSGPSESGDFHLKAPMPGLVVAIRVSEGQEIQKGDVLLVLESMKMQNELKAPRGGIIARLRVEEGDSVEQHQTLLSVVV